MAAMRRRPQHGGSLHPRADHVPLAAAAHPRHAAHRPGTRRLRTALRTTRAPRPAVGVPPRQRTSSGAGTGRS